MKFWNSVIFSMAVSVVATELGAEEGTVNFCSVNVDVSTPGTEIFPKRYGIFFEDINFSTDGGLYAELIKNRSFEFPQSFMGWKVFGDVKLRTGDGPFERNPHYIRLSPASHRDRRTGIENEGFRGIAWEKGKNTGFPYGEGQWTGMPNRSSCRFV